MEALTVALIVVLSALTLVLYGLLVTNTDVIKRGRSASGILLTKNDIEELLSEGKADVARNTASKWMRKESRNTAAYMLLIKAEFRLGEYIEAKKAIEELSNSLRNSNFPHDHTLPESMRSSRIALLGLWTESERKPCAQAG